MEKTPIGTVGLMSGIPFQYTEFLISAVGMCDHSNHAVCSPDERVHWVFSMSSEHARARNQLAEEMLGDWLLMLDCDHAFAPNLLECLVTDLQVGQFDVVTGVYVQRSTCLPVLYEWDDASGGVRQVLRYPTDGLFEVGACGGGCLLVRRSVFDRIRNELGEQPFDNRYTAAGRLSEDLSFCHRCRQLGIRIYCDPRVEARHLMVCSVGAEDIPAIAMPETVEGPNG